MFISDIIRNIVITVDIGSSPYIYTFWKSSALKSIILKKVFYLIIVIINITESTLGKIFI